MTPQPHDHRPEWPRDGLEPIVRGYLAWYRLPGLADAVMEDGEVVFARGYGVRYADGGDPITPSALDLEPDDTEAAEFLASQGGGSGQ